MNTTAKIDMSKNVLIAGFVIFLALPYLDGCSDKLKSYASTVPTALDDTLPTLPTPDAMEPPPYLTVTSDTLTPSEAILGTVIPDTVSAPEAILGTARVDLSDITADQELYVRSDATQNAPVLDAQVELQQLRAEVAELNEKVLAIVTAVSNGSIGNSMTRARVEGIARNITAHYWNNHDAVANNRGYKSVIKWKDVNY